MRIPRTLGLGTAVLAAAAASQGRPAERPARNDIAHTTEVATPHVPWAKRLPGGPIRGFFIPSISRGRDMAELMQRLALEPTTVSIDRNWDVNCWGIGDFYGHETRGDRDDFRIVYGYVEEDLTSDKPFEVLVIPGLNGWSRLTHRSRDAILRRVEEGAGLLLIHPFVGDVKGHPFAGDEAEPDTRIWDISPLVGVPDDRVSDRGYPEPSQEAIGSGRWRVARPHFITRATDLALVPSGARGGRFYLYEPRGDVLVEADGHPVVAAKSYGKGRVVAFAHVGEGFIPDPVDPVATRTYWDYWEYQYALLAKAIVWAAGREADLHVFSMRATEVDGLTLEVEARAPHTVEVEVAAKSELGPALGRGTIRRQLAAGTTSLSVAAAALRPETGWPGGRQILDVIVRDAGSGATLDWGFATFEIRKPASVTGIRPNAPVYREGETMSVVARSAGELAGLRARLALSDDLGRIVQADEKPARGETAFSYRLDDVVGRRIQVSVQLVDARGRVVDELRHEPLLVVQRERRQREYQALLSFETPPHSLAALRQRRLRALGMTSGFTWGGAVNDELNLPRGSFGVYWYDRGPTTPEAMERAIAEFERTGDSEGLQYLTKKELFRRTGDKRFLARTPCFDDPAVLELLSDISRAAARGKAMYNMDYYFVGDEGSLGSYADPVEFCFGPHTLRAFREWLKTEYGTLEALNRSWRGGFREWGEVLPLTADEARKSGRFAPWADHRAYMEVTFANAYAAVRKAVREGDPDGRIALSGTQVTTPYNGCDWFRLDRIIDDFLSYSGGNQWEIHRSFAKPGARVGFWTGYGRSGAAVKHEVWSAALGGVLFPNLFWSPSIVNPDLTFSRSGRDLGEAFRALRFEGIGKLLMESERVSDGVALHYSMASVHAAGILGHHANNRDDGEASSESRGWSFPGNRDGWVRVLSDLGLSVDFVSSEQVESGALGGQRIFVLPLSLALSPAETEAIRRFVESGGVVIADGAAGLMDEHCVYGSEGRLDTLFGIAAPPAGSRGTAVPRVSGPISATDAGMRWGLSPQTLDGLEAMEPGVRAAVGEALLKVGSTGVVITRSVGAGRAVYLNMLLDSYPRLRGKNWGGGAYRTLIERVLDQAGIRPAVAVLDSAGQPAPHISLSRYRFGEDEVVAVLNGNLGVDAKFGVDGVTAFEKTVGPESRQDELTLRLPRVANVTNARTGEALGLSGAVRAKLAPGDALVLALGKSRGELALDGAARARRGEHLAFILRTSASGLRLIRCHVFDPENRFVPEYARNVLAEGGIGRFVLPTARSDAPGRYLVRARDVTGGAAAEVSIALE
jgi:hypothetical protein